MPTEPLPGQPDHERTNVHGVDERSHDVPRDRAAPGWPDEADPRDPLVVPVDLDALLMTFALDIAGPGWDEPALVFFVQRFDFGSAPDDTLDDDADDVINGFGLSSPLVLDGHPFDALVGLRAPDGTDAALIVTEGWAGDGGAGQRVEVKIVQLVWRDGTTRGRIVRRDGGPEPGFDLISGRVCDALRRTLGLPSTVPLPEIDGVRRAVAVTALLDLSERGAVSDLIAVSLDPAAVWSFVPETLRVLRASHWEQVLALLGDDPAWRDLVAWADMALVANELVGVTTPRAALGARLSRCLTVLDAFTLQALDSALTTWQEGD